MDSAINYIWTPSTSGRFTVSSAYRFISDLMSNNSSTSTSPQFWKAIWKLNLNDWLRIFIWKIAWNMLPTKERLCQISIPILDSSCPLCKLATDSLQHLFFECFFARVVWRHSFWPLDSTALHFDFMSDWVSSIISPGSSIGIPFLDHHKFQIFAAVACDILWFYRNKALHEGASFNAISISNHINKISMEHFQAWHSSSTALDDTWFLLLPIGSKSILILLFVTLFQPRQRFAVMIMDTFFMQHPKLVIPALQMKEKPWQPNLPSRSPILSEWIILLLKATQRW
jgi:hypothetical protein